MTTSSAQQDFEQRFNDAIDKRTSAREKLRDTQAQIARLKADAAQAGADVAKIRADAKAAGVSLSKTAKGAGAPANGGPVVPHAAASESDNGED
jgi:predicted  nucleic acid-binding Zn-ribbon protein